MEKFEKKEINESPIRKIAEDAHLKSSGDEPFLLREDLSKDESRTEGLFQRFPIIESDPVLRSEGGSTIFTTAGIQHLETLERDGVVLDNQKFQIAQPVIRSQYLDKIEEGYSTAFIHQTVVAVGESQEDFSNMCKEMIAHSRTHDADIHKYRVTIHEEDDRWGDKKFSKIVFTLFYNNTEVSEGLFIKEFPKKDSTEKVSVSEICWSLERLRWLHDRKDADTQKYYFQEFWKFYDQGEQNAIARIIDPIRTATLMMMQAVTPAHKDPGFRLRQLIKRFAERNMKIRLPPDELISLSLQFWESNGVVNMAGTEQLREVFSSEIERAYNVYLAKEIEKITGRPVRIDVNQQTLDFISKIRTFSPSKVVQIMEEVNRNAYDI